MTLIKAVNHSMISYHLDETEKQESEKTGLKFNIQKMKTMASGPISSWQIDRETMETVTDLLFWVPQSLQMVTAAMKLYLLLGRKTKIVY